MAIGHLNSLFGEVFLQDLCPFFSRVVCLLGVELYKEIYRFSGIPMEIPIFHRYRTNIPKIYIEPQKPLNSLRNLEKEEQSRRHRPTCNLTILQGHCNQNSLALALEQAHRSMRAQR